MACNQAFATSFRRDIATVRSTLYLFGFQLHREGQPPIYVHPFNAHEFYGDIVWLMDRWRIGCRGIAPPPFPRGIQTRQEAQVALDDLHRYLDKHFEPVPHEQPDEEAPHIWPWVAPVGAEPETPEGKEPEGKRREGKRREGKKSKRTKRAAELLCALFETDSTWISRTQVDQAGELDVHPSTISRAFRDPEYGPRLCELCQQHGVKPPTTEQI
jgi:hypothetical protein